MRSTELFAGAGGLGLGVSAAGFEHTAVIEMDRHACDTIRENQRRGIEPVVHWPLHEADVRDFDYSCLPRGLDLLTGGPPCQPFSLGGKKRGRQDGRDMFPEAVRAVRELRPRAFKFENVKGLTRPAFTRYLEYIRLQLTYPDSVRMKNERWTDHHSRLERHFTSGRRDDFYRVVVRSLNVADYGVAQRRNRVFIVGLRSDLEVEWCFPNPTHSREELLQSKWTTGDYWKRHCIAKRCRPAPPTSQERRCANKPLKDSATLAWRTVRDEISDLPDPEAHRDNGIANHRFVPGARSYSGHTGSPLDEPAKTLKAGNHGVPGGENMLRKDDGSVRYFTIRECARLQAFPDDYVFFGPWSATIRQLGNAVPVSVAQIVANSVRTILSPSAKPPVRSHV